MAIVVAVYSGPKNIFLQMTYLEYSVMSLNSSITWSVDKASLGVGIKRKDLLPELLAQVQKPLSSFLGFKCLLFRIKTRIYASSLLGQ